MNFKELATTTRTCRRFDESKRISLAIMQELVALARLAGSARNCQPWQYSLINDQQTCDELFPYLGWAGYLTDWRGPAEGERPTAYILCLLNHEWLKGSEKEAYFDLGIASQNMLLGASAINVKGCRIGAFSPEAASLFQLPDNLTLELIIALGYPGEEIMLDDAKDSGDIKYWRDRDGIHHVPKRNIDDIIFAIHKK